jgi:hypothetical protein
MILEGLVTTTGADGRPHLAPMGPTVSAGFSRLLLRPFPTSQTGQNLLRLGEGVFQITDDAALIARSAAGLLTEVPPTRSASAIRGFVLDDCCRSYEFVVRSADTTHERFAFDAEVVAAATHREFLGFNRARNALLEAAILATRFHLLPADEIEREYEKLATIVGKTGDEPEKSAMAELNAAFDRYRAGSAPR